MKTKPKILCPITDWEERKMTRGRGAGKVVKERHVIGADKHNWFFAIQREDQPPDDVKPHTYLCTMRQLFPTIKEMGLDVEKAVNLIIGALVERTNKRPALMADEDPYKDLTKLGKWVDSQFDTSYMAGSSWPPQVYENIFKDDILLEGELVDAEGDD